MRSLGGGKTVWTPHLEEWHRSDDKSYETEPTNVVRSGYVGEHTPLAARQGRGQMFAWASAPAGAAQGPAAGGVSFLNCYVPCTAVVKPYAYQRAPYTLPTRYSSTDSSTSE